MAQPVREKVPGVANFYRVKRSQGYAYYFRYPGQRSTFTRIPGFPSVNEAKRLRNQALGLEEHERTITSDEQFGTYAVAWIKTTPTLKERTRRAYLSNTRLHLSRLERLRLHEITPDLIRRQVIAPMVAKGLEGATVKSTLTVLSSVLSAALDDHKIVTNPCASLGRRAKPKLRVKLKRILTPEQAANFLAVSGDNAALFGVMLFCGLRISEAVGLTWGDIDFKTNKVHVWRQLAYRKQDVTIGDLWTSTKNGADRRVEIPAVLRSILIAHLGGRVPHAGDLLFATRNATPISQSRAGLLFRAAVAEAGLDNEPTFAPHQCRHNFASGLIAAGCDVGFVADQLGHEDPNVTLRTYRSEFRDAREAGSGAAAIDAIYGAAMAAAAR